MRLLEILTTPASRVARFLPRTRWLWAPTLAGLAVASASLALYQTLLAEQSVQVGRTVEAEAARIGSEVTLGVTSRVTALARMAVRWERRPKPDREQWQADAGRLIGEDLQFRALEWREPSLDVRWTAPPTAHLARFTLDPRDDEIRRRELEGLGNPLEPFVSRSFPLADAHRQILMFAPMLDGERRAGAIVGVIRTRDLLDALVGREIARGYSISVYEGPFLIFGPVWEESGPESEWTSGAEAQVNELGLRFRVWPTPELLKRMGTSGPVAALAFGLVLAALCAVGVHLLQSQAPRPHGTR